MIYSFTELIFLIGKMMNHASEFFLSRRFVWNFLDLASSLLVITFGIIVFGYFRAGKAALVIAGLNLLLALAQAVLLYAAV